VLLVDQKFTGLFSLNEEGIAVFPILNTFIRSGYISDLSLKLSEVNLILHVYGPQLFFGGGERPHNFGT